MSFFNRRRSEFGASPVPNEQLNLTNYDERTVFPTEGLPQVQPPVAPQAMQQPMQQAMQQPVQQPLPSATTTAVYDGVPPAPQQSAPVVGFERPMVFASKAHSGIYIYEYSDRLEYFVKTETYMHKFDTVYKKK